MTYDLDVVALVTAMGVVVLGAVYLWSKDAGRRQRALKLLKLILRSQ
jgi:hypothetical protein